MTVGSEECVVTKTNQTNNIRQFTTTRKDGLSTIKVAAKSENKKQVIFPSCLAAFLPRARIWLMRHTVFSLEAWDGIHQIISRFLERFRFMCPLLFSCVFPSSKEFRKVGESLLSCKEFPSKSDDGPEELEAI
jgi:myosin-crossreactive antigen